jgi:hypothetical protein
MADRDRAIPQMNDLDGMGMAVLGPHMVVVPSVRCRCRALGDQSGALLLGVSDHVPSLIQRT